MIGNKTDLMDLDIIEKYIKDPGAELEKMASDLGLTVEQLAEKLGVSKDELDGKLKQQAIEAKKLFDEKPLIFKGFSYFQIKYTKKVKNIFKTY